MEEKKVITTRPTGFLALTILFFFVFVVLGFAQSSQEAARPVPGTGITNIQLSFKRDPRVVDPYRGVGPWAPGTSYAGATGQDTVEVRAEGVDAAGRRAKINPQWVPSDPEMVTVSPSQGDDVKITVHRAGQSKLKVAYQGFSQELEVSANYQGNFLLFKISQPAAAKPAPVATRAAPARKTKNDVSYAAGMNLAKALEEQSVEVDVDLLMQGVKDTLSRAKTLMTDEEVQAALEGLQTDQRIVQQNLTRKALGEKNKREGEAFLAANKQKEGVVTLASGLQYKIIKAGEGKKPTANDVVTVQYRGTFVNGKEFDNTFGRSFVTVPVNAVIKGWREVLPLMPVGSKWQLFVPSDLAYGERGAGGGAGKRAGGLRPQTVGPNATLIFELELLSIKDVATNEESIQARPVRRR